jgi:biopolymer transport protein ExbB
MRSLSNLRVNRFGDSDASRMRAQIKWGLISLLALVFAIVTLPNLAAADEAGPEAQPVSINDNAPDKTTSDDKEEEAALGIPTHPVEIIKRMNYWLVPFVIASVIAVWFGIERLVVLRRTRVVPLNFVEPFLHKLTNNELSPAEAMALCNKSKSPVAAVFSHAVQKWGRPSIEVEQAVIDGGDRQVGQLRRHLRVINGVATVTPLLGLLGTVVGMIQAFNDIASAGAMGKADQLAAGIAMALLTTAFGLAIAIPSLIMYMFFCGRVEGLVMEMDELSQHVVKYVSADNNENRVTSGKRVSRSPTKAESSRGASGPAVSSSR